MGQVVSLGGGKPKLELKHIHTCTNLVTSPKSNEEACNSADRLHDPPGSEDQAL